MNSQVIEIIGKGIFDIPNSNLPIADIDNISKIDAGANPEDVLVAFKEATEFLKKRTPQNVIDSKSLQKECVRLGGILDDFNNGRMGPGHCDDGDEDEASIDPIQPTIEKVSIYPNPARGIGRIEFVPRQSAQTTIELYNINGQLVHILYNQKANKGIPVSIEYNTEGIKKGLYFAIIRNGSQVFKEKISIAK